MLLRKKWNSAHHFLAVRGERAATGEKHFKLFFKSNENESPEAVKVALKKKCESNATENQNQIDERWENCH